MSANQEPRRAPLDPGSGAAVDQAGPSPALIPSGGEFEGQVAIVGETRIDGTVRGALRGPGTLVVGATANIEGEIECESVLSEGRIAGPVVAHRRAQLGSGAHFDGDLVAPILELEDSAVWNGRARVGPAPGISTRTPIGAPTSKPSGLSEPPPASD